MAWPSPAQEEANYREQAAILVSEGVDLIFTEMVRCKVHGLRVASALADRSVPVFMGLVRPKTQFCSTFVLCFIARPLRLTDLSLWVYPVVRGAVCGWSCGGIGGLDPRDGEDYRNVGALRGSSSSRSVPVNRWDEYAPLALQRRRAWQLYELPAGRGRSVLTTRNCVSKTPQKRGIVYQNDTKTRNFVCK